MIKKLTLALIASSLLATAAQAQSNLPANPKRTCTVTKSMFASWFVDDKITKGGRVQPADSVGFPGGYPPFKDNTTCDFYRWSAQMFLWLTSSAPGAPGRYVFDSDLFYDVSPENAKGQRVFIPNTSSNLFSLRSQKPEEIDETGQAGGDAVLISQQNSLVYYGIHTNDVYAYFLSGQKLRGPKGIPAEHFPTSQTDLDAVEKFAGRKFADGKALTMELKTSWIDVTTLAPPDRSKYLTIEASVPIYDRKEYPKTRWKLQKKLETKTLALVGFHIVGTVQGHPEMVWATFEHVSNTPDNDYFYATAPNGTVQSVKYNSGGKWLFMATNGSKTGANTERAKVDGGDIVNIPKQTIGPSNTYRINPWGSQGGLGTVAPTTNNTEIISLNTDVLGLLAPGDVRANYILIGALWTQLGHIPPKPNTQKGSLLLTNSTMETYHQDLHCFTCHQGPSFKKDALSHIYWELEPLP